MTATTSRRDDPGSDQRAGAASRTLPRLLQSAAAALLLCAIPALAAPDGEGDGEGGKGARPAAAGAAAEDAPAVLVLRDGRRLEGNVVAEDAAGVTFRSGGTTRFHAADAVERIERGVAPAKPAADPAPGKPVTGRPESERAPKERDAGRKAPPPLSAAAAGWIDVLVKQASSEDEQVRRSVAAALRALGPSAVPAIRAAAESASDQRARDLLTRVAADTGARRDGAGEPKGEGAPAPGTQPPDGKRPPEGRPGRGAALERIAAELELREEQRPGFAPVVAALERESQAVLREVRQGALPPKDASVKLDEIRARTTAEAAKVLDAGQAEAFRVVLERYVAGQLDRASKAAGKRPPEGQPPEKQPPEK